LGCEPVRRLDPFVGNFVGNFVEPEPGLGFRICLARQQFGSTVLVPERFRRRREVLCAGSDPSKHRIPEWSRWPNSMSWQPVMGEHSAAAITNNSTKIPTKIPTKEGRSNVVVSPPHDWSCKIFGEGFGGNLTRLALD